VSRTGTYIDEEGRTIWGDLPSHLIPEAMSYGGLNRLQPNKLREATRMGALPGIPPLRPYLGKTPPKDAVVMRPGGDGDPIVITPENAHLYIVMQSGPRPRPAAADPADDEVRDTLARFDRLTARRRQERVRKAVGFGIGTLFLLQLIWGLL
jgi:hypothetical protein